MAELKPCGTAAAWRRHKRHGEEPCAACRKAHSRSITEHRRKPWAPRELRPHGTEACYQRELRSGEGTCFKCRLAHSEYVAKYVARKRAAA